MREKRKIIYSEHPSSKSKDETSSKLLTKLDLRSTSNRTMSSITKVRDSTKTFDGSGKKSIIIKPFEAYTKKVTPMALPEEPWLPNSKVVKPTFLDSLPKIKYL